LTRIEYLIPIFIQAQFVNFVTGDFIDLITDVAYILKQILDTDTYFINNIPQTVPRNFNEPGRPSYDIPRHWLCACLENGFTQKDIAMIVGVSAKTISRRISDFKLREIVPKYTEITDDALEDIIRDLCSRFPNSGIRTMKGLLVSHDIRVTWERVTDVNIVYQEVMHSGI